MQQTRPTWVDTRATRPSRARRGALAAAGLLVATAGFATTATGADAAPKKKATVAVIKIAGVPQTVTGAAAFKVTTTVRNTGSKAAKASVAYRLSKDRRVDAKDTKLASATTGKLRPKKAKKIRTALRIPRQVPAGSFYVLACSGSSCKATKTQVLRSETPAPSASDRGTLTGTLNFNKSTPFVDWDTVNDKVQLSIAMNYVGPFEARNDLVSTGSSFTYAFDHRKTESGSGCSKTTTDVAEGAGPLTWTGDRYTDGIYGSVTTSDLSEVRVTVTLRYGHKETVTTTGDQSCSPGTKETTGTGTVIADILLGEVSRKGSDITYQVKSVNGSYGTTLDLGTPTGSLTLRLG